jgi:hypothetical protein
VSGVTVRVEGLTTTLLPRTTLTLHATKFSKDGLAADSCSGLSVLGALQEATGGDFNGTWSKSYDGYFITSILGVAYKSTASYYWSLWVNDKPATAGACAIDPKPGSSILFFPQYDGSNKKLLKPGVLGVAGPTSALLGKPFTLTVYSYANANGQRSPASGASVTAQGQSVSTQPTGRASLTLSFPGDTPIEVSAPNSIRTEATVCIHAPGKTCKAPYSY